MNINDLRVLTTKEVRKFLMNDRKDGVKQAWYYYHNRVGSIMALDNKELHDSYVNILAKGDIKYVTSRAITVPSWLKCKRIEIEIYKHNNNHDLRSIELVVFFGYVPASDETVLIKVTF